ncbi:Homer 1 [Liparis tanakae]|uniref:Homer 1 n=1 Tax=Liparis tanakae TaxID=230148 RepID=A0A4Z2GBH6_9TELE|nr:Homer 1 [Liparis tanakae]
MPSRSGRVPQRVAFIREPLRHDAPRGAHVDLRVWKLEKCCCFSVAEEAPCCRLLVSAPWSGFSQNRKGNVYKCQVSGSRNSCDKLDLQDSVYIPDVKNVNDEMCLGLTLTRMPAVNGVMVPCGGPMDIVIVLDGSNSIYPWAPMNEFLRKLIPALDIGPKNTQVSVIQYGVESKFELRLNEYKTKDEVLAAASRITQMFGSSTNTFHAIQYASSDIVPLNTFAEKFAEYKEAARLAKEKSQEKMDMAMSPSQESPGELSSPLTPVTPPMESLNGTDDTCDTPPNSDSRPEPTQNALAFAHSPAMTKHWEAELDALKGNNAKLTAALLESTANVKQWKQQLAAYQEEAERLHKRETELRSRVLEEQLVGAEQRLEENQEEQESFRKSLRTLLELLDGKIFELTELRDTLARLIEEAS